MKNELVNNLLVIGNGFDLHCTLKSRFTDFFSDDYTKESRIVANELYNKAILPITFDMKDMEGNKRELGSILSYPYPSIFQVLYSILRNSYKINHISLNYEILKGNSYRIVPKENQCDINFFLLYFYSLKKLNRYFSNRTNWADVENQLYVFLSRYAYRVNSFLYSICKLLNSKKDIVGGIIDILHSFDDKNIYDSCIVFISSVYLLITGIIRINSNRSKYIVLDIYSFLFNQLNKFEKLFAKYLIKECKSNNKYISNIKQTLDYINGDNDDENLDILSFNYTDISRSKGSRRFNNIKHVHSTVNDTPIIGIDSNIKSNNHSYSYVYEEPYYMFTKTYRIMSLSNNSEYNNSYALPVPQSLTHLIFYGHSLAQEDYSYFMALFDYYKIYDSKVILIFYYSDDFVKDTKERNNIKQDYYYSVFKLINRYGSSVNHGQNLLHKLLLENRIHIKVMPPIDK